MNNIRAVSYSYFQFLWLFGFLCVRSGVSVSVYTQCTWAWYWLSGRTYTIYIYMWRRTYKHPWGNKNFTSERGSLHSPLIFPFYYLSWMLHHRSLSNSQNNLSFVSMVKITYFSFITLDIYVGWCMCVMFVWCV